MTKYFLKCSRCGQPSPYSIDECYNGGFSRIGNEFVCSDCLGKKVSGGSAKCLSEADIPKGATPNLHGDCEKMRDSREPDQKLSLRQRFSLWLRGYAYIEHRRLDGWSGALPFYVVRCKSHGLFTDYPHGFHNYFSCPSCRKEAEP